MPARSPASRRFPIRLRLTVAFTGVLAATVAAAGVVLYTQFRSDLDDTIDQDLTSRVADVAAFVSRGRDPGERLALSGERVGQVYGGRGRRLASTRPVGARRLLTVAEARRTGRGGLLVERRATPVGDVRL